MSYFDDIEDSLHCSGSRQKRHWPKKVHYTVEDLQTEKGTDTRFVMRGTLCGLEFPIGTPYSRLTKTKKKVTCKRCKMIMEDGIGPYA